jgi:hypothetical protein
MTNAENHKLGPFRPFDIRAIEEILRRLGVAFEVIVDEAERDRKIAEHNERATPAPRQHAGDFDASYIYFKIDEADFAKIGDRLEKFGVASPSDGSELDVHEFVCPKCKYRDYDMPRCLKCHSPTVELDSESGKKVLYGDAMVWTKEKIVAFFILFCMAVFFIFELKK